MVSPRIIAISTSSFGQESAAPLERLTAAGFVVRPNPHGRALTTDEAAVQRMVQAVDAHFHRLDVVVNSAGILEHDSGERPTVVARCGGCRVGGNHGTRFAERDRAADEPWQARPECDHRGRHAYQEQRPLEQARDQRERPHRICPGGEL